MSNKCLQKAVIYQGNNEIWVISTSWWNKLLYDENIKIFRLLVTEVSQEFWKYTKEITKQELANILMQEMDKNPQTVYF